MSCEPAQPTRRYLIGNAITIRAILTDTEGEVIPPANLQLRVAGPSDMTSTVYPVTTEGDEAVVSFTPDEAGVWRYRLETFQGPVNAALERTVVITASALP
jgi:hypothetical protein